MTAHKRLKRRVRARVAKTGESYTAALRHLRSPKEGALPAKDHECWFCREKAHDHAERKFFVGPGTTICSNCVECLHELIPREPDPTLPKTQDEALARYSDEQLLESLKNYVATATAAETALRHAVLVRQARGIGWKRIAEVLELTTAQARRRFEQ